MLNYHHNFHIKQQFTLGYMYSCAICDVTLNVRRASEQEFAQRRKLQYLRNSRGFIVSCLLKLYAVGALQRRGKKMQLNDSAYNWVIFLMLNAVSTVLFSVS
jgi:hypothetical protein